jgi:2-dehydropantoate 2-reductase
MIVDRPIAIAGAGTIGCFVGGQLAAAGRDVRLLARPRVIEEIKANGLRLTGFDGLNRTVALSQLRLSEDPAIMNDVGVVLVTVKSADSADIAGLIAQHAPSAAIIVSLQNGVGNAALLRERLPGRRVLGGMVPFNVVAAGAGQFHRASAGDIVIEKDDTTIGEQLSVPGLKLRTTSDIAGVQWGKLLVNLNNALNALSGLTLQEQLAQRPWRRLLADQISEGLAALKAEGVVPVSPTPIPLHLMPHLLRLPDPIFNRLLVRTMKIDPEARSSMSEDLQRGRRTEIDYLQGVIAGIAERHGLPVPLSRRVIALIKRAEADGKGSPQLESDQIRP